MKFLAHFGLKHVPFHKGNVVLWDNKSLDELATKFNRLLTLPGIGILTGEFGLGKSSALRKITATLNPHMYEVIYISETGFSRNEFYRILARKLDVELAFRRSDLWYNIREKLVNLKTQRKVLPVIIIEEAQNLPHEFFSDLASFLNFNYDSEDIVTLWLVGNKQLMLKIKQARHNALSSRVRIYHDLKQIESFEEFKKFIDFGFNEAGAKGRLLSDAGLRILRDATKAAPRQIYNAIANCLEVAYEKKLNHIPDELLEQVLCDML